MARLSVLLFSVLLTTAAQPIQAQGYAQHFSSTLDEAQDYLTVDPARSLRLLDDMGPILQPPELSLKWHILLMRAAVPTGQTDRILPALDIVFNHQKELSFLRHLTSINSAAGVWLRKNNYLAEAKLSFSCAEKYASTAKQKLTLLNSMGLLHRELNEYDEAHAQFSRALVLAQSNQQTRVEAMLQNNLGLLALDQGDLPTAASYFRSALQHYQLISQRSGQIAAGLNLMLVSLLKSDTLQYQRIHAPTAALTGHFPNESRQALLLWLDSYYRHLQGMPRQVEPQQLQLAFTQLGDNRLRQLIERRLAPALQITPTPISARAQPAFNRSWFSLIRACSWPVVPTPH